MPARAVVARRCGRANTIMSATASITEGYSGSSARDLLEARAECCFQRIEALHTQLRKSTNDLLLVAYRLGLELKALREQSRHGQWEKLFTTRVAFIGLRRAYDALNLAEAFQGEDHLAGLTLEAAKKLARGILDGHGKRERVGKRNSARRGFLATCETFRQYLGRARLAKKAAGAALHECDAAIRQLTAIRKATVVAVGEYEKRRRSLRLRLVGVTNGGEQATPERTLAATAGCR